MEKEKKLENVHLIPAGNTEDFGTVYSLSTRVPPSIWNQIKEYFFFSGDDSEMGGDADFMTLGWITVNPLAVEEILSVKPELRISEREKQAKERKKKAEAQKEVINNIKKQIKFHFKEAEKPKKEQPLGEIIQDPLNPENIYGSGHWWVIGPDWIWDIQNNGMDGDNWGNNNVQTHGAGAIGFRKPHSESLESLIRQYAAECKKLQELR